MVRVLVHHAAHAVLAHPVHPHAVVVVLLGRPVTVHPRVFGTLALAFTRLVRLLGRAFRLSLLVRFGAAIWCQPEIMSWLIPRRRQYLARSRGAICHERSAAAAMLKAIMTGTAIIA